MNGLFNVTKHINHTKLGLSQNILIFFKIAGLAVVFQIIIQLLNPSEPEAQGTYSW